MGIEDLVGPIMFGILLKLLAIIPIVLVKLSVVGLLAILGSKISLLISAGGFIRNLIGNSETKKKEVEMNPMSVMMSMDAMGRPNMLMDAMYPPSMSAMPENVMTMYPIRDKLRSIFNAKKQFVNTVLGQPMDDMQMMENVMQNYESKTMNATSVMR